MALSIKPAFVNVRIGFNGSAIPLGQRSQSDLKLFLILSYSAKRTDYVAMFLSPPTLDELLGNPPLSGGGTDLSVATLRALLSDDGNIAFTQTGGKIRADQNIILDAPTGLQSFDGAGTRFYDRAAVDAKIAFLLSLINSGAGGSAGLEDMPILVDWLKIEQNVTLVGGEMDSWLGIKGKVTVAAPSATQRPAYSLSAGPNGKPCVTMSGAKCLVGNVVLDDPTQDLLVVTFIKQADVYTQGGIVRFGGGDWFYPKTKNGIYQMTNYADGSYSEAETPATANTWVKIEAHSYRSLTTGEAGISANGVAGTQTIDQNSSESYITDSIVIGAGGGSGGENLNGQITDVLFFRAKPSTAQANAINITLQSRFSL